MQALINAVNRSLAGLVILLSCALVACVVWQVLSRYLLGDPSTITDELARYLFMWTGLIGAAYTSGQKKHLAIDLLTMNLTGTRKRISQLFIEATTILFASIVMIYGGGKLFLKILAMGQVSPALGMPMGLIYLALPVSGALILFYSLLSIIDLLRGTADA
ncbi:TRAP transporter small permease [Thalassotalea sp. G20_0]|uniref:TRAP transporter small permease n=1 Tax=Thalassotalea sp. G20_0 TaxID=2821093 RepID=UPI001ADAFAF3|nr:TRAP transporter small permease [Thalassotalea sp. G20_0]MBO9495126.1 TRAP transporter small permease [Thalassotalea sp. G20_0]